MTHKNIGINLEAHHNRILLLSAIELFLQSYTHQIGKDFYVFRNPLDDGAYKMHHINHPKDNNTKHLLHDYKGLRKIILNNSTWQFNVRHAIELSVVIENYINSMEGLIKNKYIYQLQALDRKLDVTRG